MSCEHEGNRAAGMLKGFCQVCDPEGFKAEWDRLTKSEEKPVVKVSRLDGGYLVFCPGCQCGHYFDSRWTFNGDFDKPTFSPSMLVNQHDPAKRCHSFVQNGQWQFLSDCFHPLAGKTVDMESVD
jgi:hypothetical protein